MRKSVTNMASFVGIVFITLWLAGKPVTKFGPEISVGLIGFELWVLSCIFIVILASHWVHSGQNLFLFSHPVSHEMGLKHIVARWLAHSSAFLPACAAAAGYLYHAGGGDFVSWSGVARTCLGGIVIWAWLIVLAGWLACLPAWVQQTHYWSCMGIVAALIFASIFAEACRPTMDAIHPFLERFLPTSWLVRSIRRLLLLETQSPGFIQSVLIVLCVPVSSVFLWSFLGQKCRWREWTAATYFTERDPQWTSDVRETYDQHVAHHQAHFDAVDVSRWMQDEQKWAEKPDFLTSLWLKFLTPRERVVAEWNCQRLPSFRMVAVLGVAGTCLTMLLGRLLSTMFGYQAIIFCCIGGGLLLGMIAWHGARGFGRALSLTGTVGVAMPIHAVMPITLAECLAILRKTMIATAWWAIPCAFAVGASTGSAERDSIQAGFSAVFSFVLCGIMVSGVAGAFFVPVKPRNSASFLRFMGMFAVGILSFAVLGGVGAAAIFPVASVWWLLPVFIAIAWASSAFLQSRYHHRKIDLAGA